MDENIVNTPLTDAESIEVAEAIAEILDSKKGKDIKILPVREKIDVADYFVLASGTSNTHIKTLADEVEYQLEARGLKLLSYEGRGNNSWILLDYGFVVLHVFSREAREFYNLDKLFRAKTVETASDDSDEDADN